MIQSRLFSVVFKSLFALGAASLALAAQAQMVQVPTVSLVVGTPSSTYNGSTAATSVCAGAWTSPAGNGCSPLQSSFTKPQAIAIDGQGNIYLAEYGSNAIRVLYEGTGSDNLAIALKNANPNVTFTPTAGIIYPFGNNNQTALTAGAACGNGKALDTAGDGCPARYADFQPRAGLAVDSAGNIFFGSNSSTVDGGLGNVRVIYVGGQTVKNLILAFAPTATVTPGYVYNLSSQGGTGDTDFINVSDIAIDSNENIYVSDSGTQASETGLVSPTAGNQIKKLVLSGVTNAPGWQTYINSTGNTVGAADGDGGAATSAAVLTPVGLAFDANNNLYIADVGNDRVRVVYNTAGSKVLPTYVQGANGNAFVTPVAGNIYSVEGTTNTTANFPSGSLARTFNKTTIGPIGIDAAGNLLITLSASGTPFEIFRVSAGTGIATMLAGGAASSTYGVVNGLANPAAGVVACNNSSPSTGPIMTDAYGDGCPAIEATPLAILNQPHLVFDAQGNFYIVDDRSSGFSPVGVVRKYGFTSQFGTVATTSSATLPLAFVPSPVHAYSPSPTMALLSTGNSTTEFTDAGGDVCTLDSTSGYQTCVYYVKFTPALAGARLGALTLSSSGTTIGSALLGGIGSGAQLSIDPATQSTIGSGLGLVPAGTAVDESGNAYIADSASNAVYKSTAGASPVSFATGFNSPKQLAIDGSGTVYVADSGNNRIAAVTQAGVVSSFLSGSITLTVGNTSTTLSNPSGVAVDKAGDVFISDTGNNRVLEVTGSAGTLPAGAISALGFSGLSSPLGLAVDAAGDVFVADSGNARVVKLTPAGAQFVINLAALAIPVGVAVDAAGNLYIADSSNQTIAMVPNGSTSETSLLSATGLTGVAADSAGNLFVTASQASGLFALNRTNITVSYPETNTGLTTTQILTLTNTGNVNLTTGSSLDSGTNTTDFSVVPATTNGCTTNTVLASGLTAGQNCMLAAIFQPQTLGHLSDTVTFPTSNIVNHAQAVLSGIGANGVVTTLAISYATLAPVTPSNGPPVAGKAFDLIATITPTKTTANATGTVTFTVDNNVQSPVTVANGTAITATLSITLPLAGTHSVTAVYSGDSNYDGSTASLTFSVVTPQATSTALSSTEGSAGTASGTINTTLSATISSTSPTAPITGSATFTVDGGTPISATVSSTSPTGVASITVPLAQGSHSLVVNYLGSSYYLVSNSSLSFQIVAGTSTISLTQSPTGNVPYGQPVVVTALTTNGNAAQQPTGTVSFNVTVPSGHPPVIIAPIAFAPSVSTTLNLPAGAYTVTATYSGDSNYAPATSSTSFTVTRVGTSITLQPTQIPSTNQISFSATVSPVYTGTPGFTTAAPTGTVTFSNGTTSLGSVTLTSSGTAVSPTITNAIGTYTYTAAYSGDSNYVASTVTITPAPTFVLMAGAPSLSVPQNAVGVEPISLTSFYGYAGTVQISCTGMPINTACDPEPSLNSTSAGVILTADGTGTDTVQVFTNAPPNSSAGLIMPNHQARLLFAGGLGMFFCLGLPLWKRRRRLSQFIFSILLLATAMSLSSCASSTKDTNFYITPTGTYTINIIATDGTVTSTTSFSLTVLPGTTADRF